MASSSHTFQCDIFFTKMLNTAARDIACGFSVLFQLGAWPALFTAMFALAIDLHRIIGTSRRKQSLSSSVASSHTSRSRKYIITMNAVHLIVPTLLLALSTLSRPASYAFARDLGCQSVLFLCKLHSLGFSATVRKRIVGQTALRGSR